MARSSEHDDESDSKSSGNESRQSDSKQSEHDYEADESRSQPLKY